MGKITGFMEYERMETQYRPIRERISDYFDLTMPADYETIICQSARCMNCGVSFCHSGIVVDGGPIGCPLGNLIPEINDLVYNGDIEGAYDRMSLTHPFPEFTSRVCPALCEGSCVLGEHEPPVTVKNIERYVIDYMLENNKIHPRTPRIRTGKKVAVVGSGPAGLACADMLNRLGNLVTVFERADTPGGLLMYGIPNMKLEKSVVMNRIRIMIEENINFVTNSEVGFDVPIIKLMNDFDAVVLCCGAANERKLDVPGANLKGVHTAMEFLSESTKGLIGAGRAKNAGLNAHGKNVVVVGGGDTGTDCVATSIRQGAKSVIQLEILPSPPENRAEENPWPLWPRIKRTEYGQHEAIELFGADPRRFSTTVQEINGSRHVSSVTTVDVEWIGREGRMAPCPLPGTEREIEADLVLSAMGFIGPERGLIDQLQLDIGPGGCVMTNDDYESNLLTVFAAGDMRTGPSLVVWALSEGRNAAIACDRYLNGRGIMI
ncbi:MAG: glutamate synthase subunit beta [Synergistaceae bacterium]|jgi:glutamate synthase (NADPH/NADH) small chain|nr:glutamate synthase subunit beta [Synergistaceae bacterium]